MNGDLTARSAIKSDNSQIVNGCPMVDRVRTGHFFTQFDGGKNRCGIALVKRNRSADVIHIGNDD